VDDLRDKVREELIRRIEAPIRRKCKQFVESNQDSGTGVRNRIISLFQELADDVVRAAAEPATKLLIERFRAVDAEILAAFGEHSDPLAEAAQALVQRQEKAAAGRDAQSIQLAGLIEQAIAATPNEPLEASA